MKLHDDKIADFLDRCYSSGIKDPVRFLIDKMPRLYGFLHGAFPRGILPTDIDGEVEINGQFLRLEFKHETALREGRVPKGQMMNFEALKRTGYFTIFLAGHDSASNNQVWKMRGDLSRFAKAIASQEISVTLEQPTQSIAAPEPPSSGEHRPACPPLRKR